MVDRVRHAACLRPLSKWQAGTTAVRGIAPTDWNGESMSTRLIEKSVNESLSAVSDSSLPIFETVPDINQHTAQSAAHSTNATCIEPLPLLSYVWRAIRELSGDDAYESYIAQCTARNPDITPLARKDFFLYQQQQKWSGIQRCC